MGAFLLNKLSGKTPSLLQGALHCLSMPLLNHSVLKNLLLFYLLFFYPNSPFSQSESFVLMGGHVPFATTKTIIAEH